MLASLDGVLRNVLAGLALQPQHNLLGGFGLLVKDWLGLPTITRLFPVITSLPLSGQTILTLLVLGHFVQGVLLALLVLAVRLLQFGYVHHGDNLRGILWWKTLIPVSSSTTIFYAGRSESLQERVLHKSKQIM